MRFFFILAFVLLVTTKKRTPKARKRRQAVRTIKDVIQELLDEFNIEYDEQNAICQKLADRVAKLELLVRVAEEWQNDHSGLSPTEIAVRRSIAENLEELQFLLNEALTQSQGEEIKLSEMLVIKRKLEFVKNVIDQHEDQYVEVPETTPEETTTPTSPETFEEIAEETVPDPLASEGDAVQFEGESDIYLVFGNLLRKVPGEWWLQTVRLNPEYLSNTQVQKKSFVMGKEIPNYLPYFCNEESDVYIIDHKYPEESDTRGDAIMMTFTPEALEFYGIDTSNLDHWDGSSGLCTNYIATAHDPENIIDTPTSYKKRRTVKRKRRRRKVTGDGVNIGAGKKTAAKKRRGGKRKARRVPKKK